MQASRPPLKHKMTIAISRTKSASYTHPCRDRNVNLVRRKRADFATGRTAFSLASGEMMRPALSLFFLMYTQIALVTSPRHSRCWLQSQRNQTTKPKPITHVGTTATSAGLLIPVQYPHIPKLHRGRAHRLQKSPQREPATRASVRGITFLPQIAARAGESVFGAKIPLPCRARYESHVLESLVYTQPAIAGAI